jgi:ketosteroid isomerase-like protein
MGVREALGRTALRLMDEGDLDAWEQTMAPECELVAPGASVLELREGKAASIHTYFDRQE